MLWPVTQYDAIYRQIQKADRESESSTSVLILVGPDVDALAATHVLTSLLQADLIAYSLVTFQGYQDLTSALQKQKLSLEQFSSVFCIQCGAVIDLAKTWPAFDGQIYVLDSHRPIHLANVYETERIIILAEESLSEDMPSEGEELDVEELSSDEEDSGRWSDEEEEEEVFQEPKRAKTNDEPEESPDSPTSDKEEGASSAGGDDDNTNNEGGDGDSNDALPEPLSRTERKGERAKKLMQYYRGSYHGTPAAMIAYEMANQLNRAQNDQLWWAILGLMKQFLQGEIEFDYYNVLVQQLQSDVVALNQHSEDITTSDGVVVPAMEDGKISFGDDYRFFLYRHWSLYDSMYHSNYVASKLKSWRAEGRDSLEVFLARMGCSLKESQQKFSFMSLELKSKLREKIQEMAPEFNMEDVFYGSFQRQFGYKYLLSAADAVHAIGALLEAPESNNNNTTMDEEDDQQEGSYWKENFHTALNALPGKTPESRNVLEKGMEMAMSLQKNIVKMAISIMERKLIFRIRRFRYATLKLTEDEENVFYHPQNLSKLALLLVDIHREAGKWVEKNALPLVMVCRNERRSTYLVVGVMCPQRGGEVYRNNLGTAFKLAADETGANYRHNGFETSVLEVEMNDIQHFVEQLHNVMNA